MYYNKKSLSFKQSFLLIIKITLTAQKPLAIIVKVQFCVEMGIYGIVVERLLLLINIVCLY